MLARCTLIAAIVGGTAYAFLIAGGWMSLPGRVPPLSPNAVVDAFEANTTPHPGFRRNHAKGICVQGRFESNGNAAEFSRASVFEKGVVPVVGRLSIVGIDPTQTDGSAALRSLALRIAPPGKEEWRMAMNSVPVFPVRTPRDVYAQLLAFRPDPKTGKRDHARIDAFRRAHPEMRAFEDWVASHRPSSGFDNAAYYSVDAFAFVDARGVKRYVRWRMAPEDRYAPMSRDDALDPDFLEHALVKRLLDGPIRWHLIVTVANADDPVDDATRLWQQERARASVDAGTLVVDAAQSQIDGPCRDLNFDPLLLPDGIEPSSDPLLAARSAVYSVSFNRRTAEEAAFAREPSDSATERPKARNAVFGPWEGAK